MLITKARKSRILGVCLMEKQWGFAFRMQEKIRSYSCKKMKIIQPQSTHLHPHEKFCRKLKHALPGPFIRNQLCLSHRRNVLLDVTV